MRRERRTWTGLLQRAVPAPAIRRGVRLCVAFAAWLALLELLRLLVSGLVLRVPTWGVGVVSGIGLSLPVAFVAGVALGALLWLSAPERMASGDTRSASARFARWCWEQDALAQARRMSAVVGAIAPLALFALMSFSIARQLVVGVAQPHFAALAILGAQLAIGLVCLALYPANRTLSAWALARVPLRWCFSRVGAVLVALGALLACGVAVEAWLNRSTLEFLPWPQIASVGGATLLALGSDWAARRQRAVARVGWVAALVLAIASSAALARLDVSNQASRAAVDETLGGKLGYAAALFCLDFDRDGALSILGGGDCAPFNPRRGPDAVEIPNNRRDEDCDGSDLDARTLGVEVRRNWPVPAAFPRKPTVVLITVDAFAAGRMRALGYGRTVTPRLDAFAAQSTLFRYAFSQGPSTRLSFPSIFTSRWDSQIKQHLVGKHPYPIDESEVMLAEVLAAEGYDTVAVISESYFRRTRWASLTDGFAEVVDSPVKPAGKHNSIEVTDAALAVLRRPRTRPLFLWVHYFDAHPPNNQPKGIEEFGKTRSDLYDAELKLVDREAGRLLAALEGKPDEGPLVLVTGDHGIAFDSPRHSKFNYGYDLTSIVLHVPLIVHGPRIRRQVLDHIVSTMDVAPTISNLLRVSQPLPFEGASLVPELFEGRPTRPQRLIHEYFLEERKWSDADPLDAISLRNEHYNLIHNRDRGSYELYAWRRDPLEAQNLADDPSYKPLLKGLKQQLSLYTYRLHTR